MTIIGYRRATILAFLVVAGLLGVTWHLLMKCAIQQANERDSWSAIVGYGRTRDVALRSEPKIAAEMLYSIAYLPARRTDTPLERIVDRERDRDIHLVIEYLRNKTGEDLGDDPAKWIEKYDPQEMRQ